MNRLRKYHNSISEWNKFKVIYDKNFKQEKLDLRPNPKTATAPMPAIATKFAEFDSDNDVVCLNPNVTPMPKMSIKTEVPEEIESFSDHEWQEPEATPQDVDFNQHGGAVGGKEPNTFGRHLLNDLLTQSPSPRKTRQTAKVLKDPPKDVTLEDLRKIERSNPKRKK